MTSVTPELKADLLREVLSRLEKEHKTLVAAQKTTQAGATHEEAKPENDKDTRALEQSYLARGQAGRVLALEQDLGMMRALTLRSFERGEPVAVGALILIEDDDGEERWLFMVPAGAGERLKCALGEVRTVTPASPLGRALVGSNEGADLDILGPSGRRTVSILQIS